jgi:hypothetical protein
MAVIGPFRLGTCVYPQWAPGSHAGLPGQSARPVGEALRAGRAGLEAGTVVGRVDLKLSARERTQQKLSHRPMCLSTRIKLAGRCLDAGTHATAGT